MSFWDGGFSGIAAGVGGLADGISNFFGNSASLAFSKEQFEYQKWLAANQLQLRVKDAQKAGLHPMAALGIGASSFSPVSVSQSPYDFSWIGKMGQSADYAALKAKDKEEQKEAVDLSRQNARLQNENLQLQNQGLQQDNEFRQWQIQTAMSGSTGQGLQGPAAPSVNGRNGSMIDGQDDSISKADSFTAGSAPLLGLARVDNTLMAHINPDISDSITEDLVRNAIANLNAEFKAGKLTSEVTKHLTERERTAILRGDAELVYTPPTSWRFVWKPHMRPRYSKDRKEVSGRIMY